MNTKGRIGGPLLAAGVASGHLINQQGGTMSARARAQGARSSALDLAAGTPSTRNRYVDLLRFVSIAVVVLGHWLIAVLGFRDGVFVGENLLEIFPESRSPPGCFR